MKQFLQQLGGAEPEVLDRIPNTSAGSTAAALGGTVLTTAAMATAAFTMALHDWLHVPVVVALVAGVAWGAAILNLDRWLLLASRRQASTLHTVALAAPRLLLALMIGFVIAEPLVLRIFEDKVTLQAKQTRQAEKASRERALDRAYSDIPVLEARQSKLQRTIAVGPTVALSGNPDYDAAKAAYNRTQGQLAKAERSVGCEAEGTCGTGKAGCGPVCQANQRVAAQRRRAAAQAERDLQVVTAQLRKARDNSVEQERAFATPELARVNRKLSQRRSEHDAELARIDRDYRTPLGAIDRMEALDRLGNEHAVVGWSTWLFRLFLIAVDTTPILFKTLLLTGRSSAYENAQDEVEAHEQTRLEATEDADDEAHRIQVKLIAEEAEIQAGHRRRALDEMHAKIAETEKEIWQKQIDDWREAVRGGGHGSTPPSTSPPATSNGAGGPSSAGAAPLPGRNSAGAGSPDPDLAPPPGRRFRRAAPNDAAPADDEESPAAAGQSSQNGGAPVTPGAETDA